MFSETIWRWQKALDEDSSMQWLIVNIEMQAFFDRTDNTDYLFLSSIARYHSMSRLKAYWDCDGAYHDY